MVPIGSGASRIFSRVALAVLALAVTSVGNAKPVSGGSTALVSRILLVEGSAVGLRAAGTPRVLSVFASMPNAVEMPELGDLSASALASGQFLSLEIQAFDSDIPIRAALCASVPTHTHRSPSRLGLARQQRAGGASTNADRGQTQSSVPVREGQRSGDRTVQSSPTRKEERARAPLRVAEHSVAKEQWRASLRAASDRLRLPQAPEARSTIETATSACGYLFISYSSRDEDFARPLRRFLDEREQAYYDYRVSGRRYTRSAREEIESRLMNSSGVLTLLSPNWKTSPWSQDEFDFAREVGIPNLLLRVRALPPTLGVLGKTYIDFVECPASGFAKLGRALATEMAVGVPRDQAAQRMTPCLIPEQAI